MHKVFVYGTLRPQATDKRTWLLSGFEMFDAGAFPFILSTEEAKAKNSIVVGQVTEVEDEELEAFDRYEGVSSGLYERVKVHVWLNGGSPKETEEVWVYVAGPRLRPYPKITTGDWESPLYL